LAEELASAARVAELEKRVRDLEAIIHRLEADRTRGNPPPPAPSGNGAAGAGPVLPTALQGREAPAVQGDAGQGGAETPQIVSPLERTLPTTDSSTGGSKDGESKSILAGWDNGFILRSADKQFNLKVTGQIQADYRAFVDDIDNVDIDRFFIRRARLGIEANMFEYYEFRLLPDFGQGQAVVQDAYLNVHYWDSFQVEAGKFKQPFSYEQLIQDRFVPTLERSMIDQLVPARDCGLMIHGQKLFSDRLDYGVSVSNGEINGNTDTNDHKDLVGRIAWRPLNDPALWPIVRNLQIGISGSTGVEQEPVSPNTLTTPATVRWFQYNPNVRADGLRNRWSPEISYFYGGFGFAAQYYREDQELRPSFVGPTSRVVVNVPYDGYYVLATYLLTGEERTTYSQPITPLRPFNPCYPFHCCGAWEAVARVSRLHVGDVVFAQGPGRLADPTLFTSEATELTLGFNWYLNTYVRTQFNWERAWFGTPVRLAAGPNGVLGRQDSLMARFQIIF
jgi:phosphate-selective porin OprO/OprP